MKPSGASVSLISRSLDLFSMRIEMVATAKAESVTLTNPYAQELAEQRTRGKESFRRQKLKKAVATIRSKSKTERLLEFCEQLRHSVRKSDAWFVKYERFFRSPVWKLVSEEAIRKAHHKCECWGCTRRAMQVQLLEFPERHLELDFDWMKRDNILMALCSHHHDVMQRFVMRKVIHSDRQFDAAASGVSGVCTLTAQCSDSRVAQPV